ncbi:MAG: TonB C-terminal domain-containing protein [Zoogloeaceae bacterium]|jgi:colicin import membrane protein|nr:TonB C-terminal domain-containing protein [Zoogloeaceae bacterium]
MVHETAQEPGKKPALMLAVLVHLALALALFLGVQWKTEHAAVEVELWSATPRPATAPAPVAAASRQTAEPAPKPEVKPAKKPDIAIRDDDKKKPEPEKKKSPEAEKKPPKPDFRAMLEEELKETRQTNQANEREARLQARLGAEQRAAGLSAWGNKIGAKIRGNIVLPLGLQGNPEAVFEITLLPTGEVMGVRLKQSSGNAALDIAIERAIQKSSPLPKPDDPAAFQRVLEIRHRPFE